MKIFSNKLKSEEGSLRCKRSWSATFATLPILMENCDVDKNTKNFVN